MLQHVLNVHITIKGLTSKVRRQDFLALVALQTLVENIHEDKDERMGQTKETFLAHHASMNTSDGECDDTYSLDFAAGELCTNPNMLSCCEAMATVDKESFEESMNEEIEKCFDNKIYEIVKHSSVPKLKHILKDVWSYRRKTTPDGAVYRYRSRIYADGSIQKFGIDYTYTYSPVLMWSILRTLFVLSKVLCWSSRKVDYLQVFPQDKLADDEENFMHIPRGFHVDGAKDRSGYVLKLKKTLYGLK